MRKRLAFVLVMGLAACGSSAAGPPPDGEIDAGISDGGSLAPPTRGFQIKSPPVEIQRGVEATYCYYFKTSNDTDLAIKRWASHMAPGSHHMIVFLTPKQLGVPGTVTNAATDRNCGFGGGRTAAVWTYSAQTVDAEALLPSDDGQGTPVGQMIKSGQYGFIQMHYLNASDDVIRAHVELNAYAYDEGVAVTLAAPFVTYNTEIDLPPGSTLAPSPGSVSGSCNVSPASKFFVVSTHAHKQAVRTLIKDGATTVFESTSWEHPGEKAWRTAPFHSFAGGKLTYQCDYMNPNNYSIQHGDSAERNEMCMAIGYFFPAVGGTGHFCLDSYMIY